MKIMITDSKGDSISITIGDTGTFQELNKRLEKGEMQMNFTSSQSEKHENQQAAAISLSNSVEKSVDEAHNSNLKLLDQQVKSCLNQIRAEPGTNSSIENAAVKLSILHENDRVQRSKRSLKLINDTSSQSICRLCASRGDDMVYMFDTNEPYKNIIEMIEDCLPIMVTKSDTLPKEACRSCLDKLELCHKFYKRVAEAEKHFLILGGKISYESEKSTKYCQTISKESRTRSSSIGNEDVINFDGTSSSQAVLRPCYSAPNSPIRTINSDEELFFEDKLSHSKTSKSSNSGRKKAKINDPGSEIIFGEATSVNNKIFTGQSLDRDEISIANECADEYTDAKILDKEDESHVCNECGKKFITAARLQFHKIYHNPEARAYYCEVCDKIYDSETSLYQHLQTAHDQWKEFRCEICGKQFRAQASVNAHQRKHRYVRSFECSVCNKRFYSKDTLEMHKETHFKSLPINENKFSCVYCGKSFTQKLPLSVHIMTHTETQSNSYDLTDKNKVTKKENKDDIQRSETRERPFKCTVCGRTFDHSARLREHASVHTGKRPYNCSVCNKSFKRANARKVHMVIHTGEKPYQCDLCGTNFRRAGDMRRHKKTQHGQIE